MHTLPTTHIIDDQLCREYSYQKLLKSDNPSSSYNRQRRASFFETRCIHIHVLLFIAFDLIRKMPML